MKYDYEEYTGFKGVSPEEIREKLRASNGLQLTESLFIDTIQPRSRASFKPLYTLRHYSIKGLPSAYQIYMHSIDEADAALKLVGNPSHWRKLCELAWFHNGRREVGFDGLSQWRMDMRNRDRTFAKKVLMDKAKLGDVSAARALDKWAQDEQRALAKAAAKCVSSKGTSDPHDGALSFLDDIRQT